jgi:hypothetical protein
MNKGIYNLKKLKKYIYGRERYGIVGYGPDDRYSVFGKRLVLGYGRQDY